MEKADILHYTCKQKISVLSLAQRITEEYIYMKEGTVNSPDSQSVGFLDCQRITVKLDLFVSLKFHICRKTNETLSQKMRDKVHNFISKLWPG